MKNRTHLCLTLVSASLLLVPAVILAQPSKTPLILQVWNGTPASLAKLIGTPRIDKSHYAKPDYLQGLDFTKLGPSFKKLLPSATSVSMNFKGKSPKASRLSIMCSGDTDVQSVLTSLGMPEAKLSEMKWREDKTPETTKYAYSWQVITYPRIKGKVIQFGRNYTDGQPSFTEFTVQDPW
ncbi:MAG: hypothetical protein IT363_08560 [Methanoregulaceae archaeon]|nr:hypothetical protein [Methanoregulaceae archaeon]